MVELIPGTSLPFHVGPGGAQPEGRGNVQLVPEREPPSTIDPNADRPSLSMAELAFVRAAIGAYDRRPRKLKTVFDTTAKLSDATTGNAVLPLFLCPAGCEAHITNVTADAPQSSSINPSAPFANAASWAFLAILAGGITTGITNASADTYRPGLVAFLPTAAAGPILPGSWTFTDAPAPTLFGGDALYYVLHGGTQAALLATTVQVTYKIELFGFEDGQL